MRVKPDTKKQPYTCPVCGRTLDLYFVPNRKSCPECSARLSKQRSKQRREERKAQQRAQEACRREKAWEETPQHIREKTDDAGLTEAQRYAIQAKQCKGCIHWTNDGADGMCFCHYYLRNGVFHRRDPGNGPGDCRSFEPRRPRTQKERADYSRRRLEETEADFVGSRPRKEDYANETR